MEEKSQTRRVLRNLRKLAPEGDGRASSFLLEELEKLEKGEFGHIKPLKVDCAKSHTMQRAVTLHQVKLYNQSRANG